MLLGLLLPMMILTCLCFLIGGRSSAKPLAAHENRSEQVCSECGHRVSIRAHHCTVCQDCTEGYDHHSVLFGACVGGVNILSYHLLILSLLLHTGLYSIVWTVGVCRLSLHPYSSYQLTVGVHSHRLPRAILSWEYALLCWE